MTFLELFLIAIGLAMDAFSVSIYKGVKEGKFNFYLCMTLGITFGLMQGLMPLIGYFITSIPFLKVFIQSYSKFFIFIFLLLIGGKMIIDAIKETIEEKKNNQSEQEKIIENVTTENRKNYFTKEVFVLGIATSIDALSIGITFTGSDMNVLQSLFASFIIAIVSFVFSFCGCCFGKILSKWIKNYAGYFGGIVLIIIGIKVLFGL